MAGAAVFMKVDANCGFWLIPLDEHSTHYFHHLIHHSSQSEVVAPKSPIEVWLFMGMLNQLHKFTPNIVHSYNYGVDNHYLRHGIPLVLMSNNGP